MTTPFTNQCRSAIIFANCEPQPTRYFSSLASVGTLPILLRTILTLRGVGLERIIVCVPFGKSEHFRSVLGRTKRLPSSVEWREIGPDTNVSAFIAELGATSSSVMLLLGDRIYQPRLLQNAAEWEGTGSLVTFTNNELAGVYVLSHSNAVGLDKNTAGLAQEFVHSTAVSDSRAAVERREVPRDSWHIIVSREDLPAAERKLNKWLVKPTDGFYAQMNRKVSIPISRQVIKLPVTPNMVSLFVLGVSLSSGLFFARGGYWSILAGALLSVFASILDGCDGEVARLKLQSTNFGCWLETVCDYLYYLFIFGGMSIGLSKTFGRDYLVWGGILCFGAVMSFLSVGYTRQHFSAAQPEKFLSVWQAKADTRSSNPLLFLGRRTEFIIRRCFFPYALLFFAVFGLTRFAFIVTALGANVVWVIAIYSVYAFSRKTSSSRPMQTAAAALTARGN